MAGDRQVGHEEPLTRGQRVDPLQDAPDCRRLVDPEAGMVIAPDLTRVRKRVEPAVADDGLHPEVLEASGVKQCTAVSALGKKRGQWSARGTRIHFGPSIARWLGRA